MSAQRKKQSAAARPSLWQKLSAGKTLLPAERDQLTSAFSALADEIDALADRAHALHLRVQLVAKASAPSLLVNLGADNPAGFAAEDASGHARDLRCSLDALGTVLRRVLTPELASAREEERLKNKKPERVARTLLSAERMMVREGR